MSKRTTLELIERLKDDLGECVSAMGNAESLRDAAKVPPKAGEEPFPPGSVELLHKEFEYHARSYFRTCFAFIEAVVYTLKGDAADECKKRGIELTAAELDFVTERDHMLTDTGIVKEQFAHIRLGANIRFTIALMEKVNKMEEAFDANVGWWSDLRKSICVRDRLTHPKRPEDLDVTEGEIRTLNAACTALTGHFMSFPHIARHEDRE